MSTYRIATLSAIEPPRTVHGFYSFIGTYNVLTRPLQGHADLFHLLDSAVAGKQSRERITWSDELIQAIKRARNCFKNTKTIALPCPDD